MKYKFLVFILLLSMSLYAQKKNNHLVLGKIFSLTDSSTIPFVNIYLKKKDIGTSSNMEGGFYLENSQINEKAILVFSHVSFQTKEVSVLASDTLTIFLEPTVFTLNEVSISAKNDDAKCFVILKKAISAMKNNYSSKTLGLSYHYLETVKFDNQYGRYVEAVGTLYDTPFDIKRGRKKKNGYYATIEQYRASENYNSDYISPINGIIYTAEQNYIKYSASFLTNNIDNTKYQYQFDGSTTFHNRKVYKISFVSKPNLAKTYPFGFIYITEDEYAIVALYTELNDPSFFNHTASKNGKTSQLVHMTTYVDYAPHGNVWVLDNINKKEVSKFYNKITKESYYIAEVDFTLSVIGVKYSTSNRKPKSALGKSSNYNRNNIYNRNYPYNYDAWQADILKSQSEPILKKIRQDIERNGNSLEQQFKKIKNTENAVYQREIEN